jgi:hypothetical protein
VLELAVPNIRRFSAIEQGVETALGTRRSSRRCGNQAVFK